MGEQLKMYILSLSELHGGKGDEIKTEKSNRLRAKILAHFSNLIAQKSGREYIIYESGTHFVSCLNSEDQDEDTIGFYKFAKSLRNIISQWQSSFSGAL